MSKKRQKDCCRENLFSFEMILTVLNYLTISADFVRRENKTMVYNPTVIAQILSTQSNYIDKVYGQMLYFTDQNQIWIDTKNGGRVLAADIVILNYERERANYIPNPRSSFPSEPGSEIPSTVLNYVIVYVVETNCLYKYQQGVWNILYGIYGSTTVAQTYLPDGTIREVKPDDVTTNGILNDGSVVIRDNNKMICGQIRSDGYALYLRSLIGGCINNDPSGYDLGNGCLQLTADPGATIETQTSKANLNSNLYVFGSIKQVPSYYWYKQYRLATEDITINDNTTVVAGSTVTAGSKLGDTSYSVDTVLEESVTTDTGVLATGSKLYKNSIINNQVLVPPFAFDVDDTEIIPTPTINKSSDVELKDTTLTVNMPVFKNTGDVCYILYSDLDLSKITKIAVKDVEDAIYDVEYVAKEGIENSARIMYYTDNKVKVLQ